MTYKDYFDWAQEYYAQLKVLDNILAVRKKKNPHMTEDQMREFDRESKVFYQMKLECARIAKILEEKANHIKGREMFA